VQVNRAYSKYMPFSALDDIDYGKPELFTAKSAFSSIAGVPTA
jgi:hypothetical protein